MREKEKGYVKVSFLDGIHLVGFAGGSISIMDHNEYDVHYGRSFMYDYVNEAWGAGLGNALVFYFRPAQIYKNFLTNIYFYCDEEINIKLLEGDTPADLTGSTPISFRNKNRDYPDSHEFLCDLKANLSMPGYVELKNKVRGGGKAEALLSIREEVKYNKEKYYGLGFVNQGATGAILSVTMEIAEHDGIEEV